MSGLVVLLYSNGHKGYSFVAVVLGLILQPLLLPGFSIPFNIVAGYTMGWFVGFLCSYAGWLIGTILTFLLFQLPGMRFTPVRLPEIKQIVEKRWWLVSVASIMPVLPIDWVARAVIMTRCMSFSKLFLSVAVAAPLSRLPPCLLGKVELFSPSLWSSHEIVSILIYATYFALGSIVTYRERQHLKHIKNLFSEKEINSFS